MEIKDLSWNETTKRFNNPLFPKSIRGIIIGKVDAEKLRYCLTFYLGLVG